MPHLETPIDYNMIGDGTPRRQINALTILDPTFCLQILRRDGILTDREGEQDVRVRSVHRQ
jgi:hypothetical protein